MSKILFISLSNIGDVILTLPALDVLRENFPESKITVMAGPRPKEIFEGNPYIEKVIVYDKHASLKDKLRLFQRLKKDKFDIVADLRNTFFGALLPARFKTSPFLFIPKDIKHMRQRHLYRLSEVVRGCQGLSEVVQSKTLYIKPEDEEYIGQILEKNNIRENDRIMVIAPGARSHIKRWAKEKFRELMPYLAGEFKAKLILVGDKDDIPISEYIASDSAVAALDLSGKTTITQLAALLKKASLLISNDSAVLHLGSYLDIPQVAIFGPTNEEKYAPWSKVKAVVKKEVFCRPCEKAQCRFGTLECMSLIKVEDVLRAIRNVLITNYQLPITNYQNYKRILIIRTDRIGDVILSTPVIKALRDAYPDAYIAMLVSPYAKDIVEGNPYLDQMLIYDKDIKHKGWAQTLKFAHNLKKKKFDLSIVLHPTNRMHLVTFFARIPKRIGYDRKLGFLLTDRIKHAKQRGQKHELEYALDLLRYLGIEPKDKSLFMPIRQESENWAIAALQQEGISLNDQLLAIHPAASCPSKIWPNERFAQAADRLIEKYGFKVLVVSAPRDAAKAQNLIKNMHHPAVNLAGRTSVSQLASVLKRCQLFISNDSGPVHIATAVGTPVISIFGRNQAGLSPKRWGPLGTKDRALHKEVGCIECLAHNCKKEFACLRAITVADVLNMVDLILKL